MREQLPRPHQLPVRLWAQPLPVRLRVGLMIALRLRSRPPVRSRAELMPVWMAALLVVG